MPPFEIRPLAADNDREGFHCGVEPLDRYFREQVGQDMRRRVTACFVAIEIASGKIAGYYTLSAGSILLSDLPPALAKRLPRYPSVPVVRLGRLAIAVDFRGIKLGAALLWDAIDRAVRSEIAAYAMAVDAKDRQAELFYRHHGFIALTDTPDTLILPLKAVRNR